MKDKLNRIIIALSVISLILVCLWLLSVVLVVKDWRTLENDRHLIVGGDFLLTQREADRLRGHFLTSSSTLKFLEEVEGAASDLGLKIVLGKAEDDKDSLKVNISTQGSFLALTDFLRRLELLPYAIRVERFDLKKEDKTWAGNFLVAVLKNKVK